LTDRFPVSPAVGRSVSAAADQSYRGRSPAAVLRSSTAPGPIRSGPIPPRTAPHPARRRPSVGALITPTASRATFHARSILLATILRIFRRDAFGCRQGRPWSGRVNDRLSRGAHGSKRGLKFGELHGWISASRSPVLTRGGICVPPSPTCRTLPRFRDSGSTLTVVGRSQLLARWPGTHSRILSGIQRAPHTVLGVCLKRTCSRVTSASSALGVLNDYALYKSTHSLKEPSCLCGEQCRMNRRKSKTM